MAIWGVPVKLIGLKIGSAAGGLDGAGCVDVGFEGTEGAGFEGTEGTSWVGAGASGGTIGIALLLEVDADPIPATFKAATVKV